MFDICVEPYYMSPEKLTAAILRNDHLNTEKQLKDVLARILFA